MTVEPAIGLVRSGSAASVRKPRSHRVLARSSPAANDARLAGELDDMSGASDRSDVVENNLMISLAGGFSRVLRPTLGACGRFRWLRAYADPVTRWRRLFAQRLVR